jgi:hypothetical protein
MTTKALGQCIYFQIPWWLVMSQCSQVRFVRHGEMLSLVLKSCMKVTVACSGIVVVTELHASRPRIDFTLPFRVA